MSKSNAVESPIPLKDSRIRFLKSVEMAPDKRSSSSGDFGSKKAKLLGNLVPGNGLEVSGRNSPRARSATPILTSGMNSVGGEKMLKDRLAHFNLDYVEDYEEHEKHLYDPESKWFARRVKPSTLLDTYVPYKVESHLEQAKYLCHVLVNLYVAIYSMDIQGLVNITSRDLAEFKNEVYDLALNSDMFRLVQDMEEDLNDVAKFDEDDENDSWELLEENDFLDGATPDFGVSGKITAKSSTVINVNHWTNELKNCMHFEFPLTLRKTLAVVYYNLCMVRGQKVYRQLHAEIFEKLVSDDDDGTDFTQELLGIGLKLDYRPMKEFLKEFLPTVEPDYKVYDISSRSDLQLFRLLVMLSTMAKPFFDQDDDSIFENTMDYFISSLAPETVSVALPAITCLVPYHYHEKRNITDYFPFMFKLWSSTVADNSFDTHMYAFAGHVAFDAYFQYLRDEKPKILNISGIEFEKFGIFSERQIDFILNRIKNHIKDDYQICSFTRVVRPLIYSINGTYPDGLFDKISELLKSIETYVHPSNSGPWTEIVARFIHGFIRMYHERHMREKKSELVYRTELKLTEECHSKMVDLFLELLLVGSQNKDSDVANYYISSLVYLLDLRPKNGYKICDKVLVDVYDSLTDQYVNSNHRLNTSLKQLTRIARFMTVDNIYRIHMTNILSILINKIDFNDISLTAYLFNCIVSITSFIPLENFIDEEEYLTFESHTIPFIEEHIYCLKEGHCTPNFVYDDTVLEQAFRASTTAFENCLRVYVDKIYQLVDVDLEALMVNKINQVTMLMMDAMNDEMFNYFEGLFERMFWENDSFKVQTPNNELVTVPLGAAVKRDSSLAVRLFRDLGFNIREQIKGGAGSIRSTSEIQPRDRKLATLLTALNDVLREAHESILIFGQDLISLLEFIYDSITNTPLDIITSMLLHNTLEALTTIEIVDTRLFPEHVSISQSEKWGGLQFDTRKYNKEFLDFKWHSPSSEEIDFAIDLFERFSNYAKKKIEELISSPQQNATYVDSFKKNILILTNVLSGCSMLFDSDFNQRSKEVCGMDPYKRKLLLLQKLRDSSCDDQEMLVDIEQVRQESTSSDIEMADTSREASVQPNVFSITSEFDPDDNHMLVDYETEQSEAPSGMATPVPGGAIGDDGSMMNPYVAFREIDIFYYNYFFGRTSDERLNDSRYIKIHHLRNEIGLFFHHVFKFLNINYENSTSVFQALLHGLKVWFTDLGQETIFRDVHTADLSLDFVENIQAIAHWEEPFLPYTRTYTAIYAQEFHMARVTLHSTNRVPSKLEAKLLNDVVSLSLSVYSNVHRPAQGCMIHAMKQLIGSYSSIVKKVFKEFQDTLDADDDETPKKLEVLLQVLSMKKIQRKMMSDFKNLGRMIKLLLRATKVQSDKVANLCDQLLDSIPSGLKIPSAVCLFDKEAVGILKPKDAYIDRQVEVVKKVKDKKRQLYVTVLEDLHSDLIKMQRNDPEMRWKTICQILKIIQKIQSHLEIKPNGDILLQSFELTKTKHPVVVENCLITMLNVSNKMISLGSHHYNVDLAFSSDFRRKYVEYLDTTGEGFQQEYEKEMDNLENPKYFIDSRAYIGRLSWGRKLGVVKVENQIPFGLKDEDMKIMKEFGNLITKEWLREICNTFIQQNEFESKFSTMRLNLIGIFVHLISNDCCSMKYEDILDLCQEIYDKDEKPSLIACSEIIAGLLISIKYTTAENLVKLNAFLTNFLSLWLDRGYNGTTTDIWRILAWWIASFIDLRRCPPIYERLLKIDGLFGVDTESSFEISGKLNIVKYAIMNINFKMGSVQGILNNLVFDHPSDVIREEVSNVLRVLISVKSGPHFRNVEELLSSSTSPEFQVRTLPSIFEEKIISLFEEIESERATITELSPKEITKTRYFYLATTMFYWILNMTRTAACVFIPKLTKKYVAPFLMKLDRLRDVCKLANIKAYNVYLELSYIPMNREVVSEMVSLLDDTDLASSHEIRVNLTFAENIFSTQSMLMFDEDKKKVLNFIVSQLFNESSIEVRLKAGKVLSGIVHNISNNEQKLNDLLKLFNDKLAILSFEQKSQLAKTSTEIHGSVLGLGAVIEAFPYVSPLPEWIPQNLELLASWARTNGMCGSAAKEIISRYKKVRADTWHLDRLQFTTEQLEDLEGVLWRGYYA